MTEGGFIPALNFLSVPTLHSVRRKYSEPVELSKEVLYIRETRRSFGG